MTLDYVTDFVRVLAVVLGVTILALLHNSLNVKGATWAPRMRRLFRFVNGLMLLLVIFAVSRIATDAQPSFFPYAECVVFMYGIYAIRTKGGYTK